MALFGKKELDGKAPGVLTPQANEELPMEQKKVLPKGKANGGAKDTTTQTTYLGKNLKINGTISGEGSLIILGTFEGEFDLKGQLKVAQGAVIKGDIKATGLSTRSTPWPWAATRASGGHPLLWRKSLHASKATDGRRPGLRF